MTLFTERKFSNKLNYIKFSGTDPTSPLNPSLPARSRDVQFLVDSVGQCTSNAEVEPSSNTSFSACQVPLLITE